jgi:tetratricopeptide (TPR) repeat protein
MRGALPLSNSRLANSRPASDRRERRGAQAPRRLALIVACLLALAPAALAIESDPLPVPREGPRQQAIAVYNAGVKLMLERRFADAQASFENALALDERLPEAHNNLAFSLRMQGIHNHARAMQHYDRALELEPRLARAYMYRGVLHAQRGELDRARADHASLLALDPALAGKLQRAIEKPFAEEYDGLGPQFD